MPLPGDIRKQVLVQVKTDGEGLAEKLAVELANATARMAALQTQIASGNTTVHESQRDWKNLNTEISFLSKELKQASDALAKSSEDYEEYQTKLQGLNQRAKDDAAEAIRLSSQVAEHVRQDWQSRVAAIKQAEDEIAAVREHLGRLEQDDLRNQQEAAALRGQSTRAAVEQYERQQEELRITNELLAEQAQAERDLMVLRQALGKMETRSHEDRADEVQRQKDLQASQDKVQSLREEQELQQALSRLDQRRSEESRSNAEKNAQTLRQGTIEVRRFTEATLEQAEAERRAAAEAEKAAARAQVAAAKTQDQMDAYFGRQRKQLDATEDRNDRVAQRAGESWRKAYDEADVARQKDAQRAAETLAAQEERSRKELEALLASIDKKTSAREKEEVRESQRNQKMLDGEIAAQRKRDEVSVSSANKILQTATIQTDEYGKLREAEMAHAAATRDAAVAARVASTEQERLNQALEEGVAAERNSAALTGMQVAGMRGASETTLVYARSHDDLTKKANESSYAMLHFAHAFQDAQYGFGAVLNNIPLVVQSLGGTAGFAGSVMFASTLAYVFSDRLKGLASYFTEMTSAVPKTGDTLKDLAGQIRGVDNAIEGMQKSGSLTNSQLEEYNRLLAEGVDLEKKKTDEMERQQRIKKLDALKDAPEAEEAKERAGILSDTFGGQQGDLVKSVRDASGSAKLNSLVREREKYAKGYEQIIKLLEQGERYVDGVELIKLADKYEERLITLGKEVDTELVARENRAKDIVSKAVVEGDKGAYDKVRDMAKKRPDLFTQSQRDKLEIASPEFIESERAFDKSLEDRKEDVKRRDENRKTKQKEADDKKRVTDQSNREHDAAVNQAASTFESALPKDLPDSLNTAVADAISRGKSDQDIRDILSPRLRKRVENAGVGKDLVGEVTSRVLASILAKTRSEAAARAPDVKAGAKEILEDAGEKAESARQRDENRPVQAENRDKRKQKAMTLGQIGAGMQQEYGLSDEQAQGIAPHVAANMNKGMTPQAAGRTAMARLQQYIEQQQKVILEDQANMERMMGILGPATMMLGQMRANSARMTGMINQAGRGANGQGMFGMFPPR